MVVPSYDVSIEDDLGVAIKPVPVMVEGDDGSEGENHDLHEELSVEGEDSLLLHGERGSHGLHTKVGEGRG